MPGARCLIDQCPVTGAWCVYQSSRQRSLDCPVPGDWCQVTGFWLCWGLTTLQPLWVILCRLPEKGRRVIEEIVEEMKERNREERGIGMKVTGTRWLVTDDSWTSQKANDWCPVPDWPVTGAWCVYQSMTVAWMIGDWCPVPDARWLVPGGHAMNGIPICGTATKIGPTPGSTAMWGGDPLSL